MTDPERMTPEELRQNLKDCRNELCLRCGEYKQRRKGACDGCRWNIEPKERSLPNGT